jgi:hypothetical protein
MATIPPQSPVPASIGTIEPDFSYVQKLVRPNVGLVLPNAWLKWYDISRPGIDLDEAGREAREFLLDEVEANRLQLGNRLGFVLLHHCASMAFLIVLTWNNENELWQTVYEKEPDTAAPFKRVTWEQGGHRPVLCVWELAPVGFERDAWVRYLRSRRTEDDKLAYVRAKFEGMC